MLKNELDEKVRKYRQEQYVNPEERIEQEKRHKAGVEEAANYVAKCIWKKLRKKFIANCKTESPVTIIIGIANDSYKVGEFRRVYYKPCGCSEYRKLFPFKKVRHIKETMKAICKIAEKEGISCKYKDSSLRMIGNFAYMETKYVKADWYEFTYTPPEK